MNLNQSKNLTQKKKKKKKLPPSRKADNSHPLPALPLAPSLSAKRDDAIPREPLAQHSLPPSFLTPSTPTLKHSTRTRTAPQPTPRPTGVHRLLALVFLVSNAQMAPSHDMENATSPRANRPNAPPCIIRNGQPHPFIIPYHPPIPWHPTVTVTEQYRLPGHTRPQTTKTREENSDAICKRVQLRQLALYTEYRIQNTRNKRETKAARHVLPRIRCSSEPGTHRPLQVERISAQSGARPEAISVSNRKLP